MKELELLNPEQKRAVLHEGPPLLILAGAGSGKTRVITTKIAYLVSQCGYDPRSILAVTFTNKAAGEMRERVLAMASQAERVMIRTFHSFGAWLLRRNTHLLGLADRFLIYDEDDQLSLLASVAGEGASRSDLKPIVSAMSLAKDRCLRPDDDLTGVSLDRRLPELYGLYQRRLREVGNVDFGDLIMLAVDLLHDNPAVRRRMRDRFRVILVDEYQDSNYAQFRLLEELHREDNYLCVVGDEDQSIYGFRGAEVNNILDFPHVFPGTEIIRLEQNYRSTSRIITAAASVAQHNKKRIGKTLWTANPEGDPLCPAPCVDEDQEASYCATVLGDGRLEDTAIVYRNNYQSRTFETLFRSLGIPYRIVGSVRFWERAEIKDALAYMALVANPRDAVAFSRIINRPPRGLGKVSQARIGNAPGASLIERCRSSLASLKGKARVSVSDFLQLIERLAEELEAPSLSRFAAAVVRATGLLDYYEEQDVTQTGTRQDNLKELVNACRGYRGAVDGLIEFLEGTSLESAVDNSQGEEGGVTLITAHNTKGLEFDRVIVTGMEEGLFPYYREHLEPDDVEEERRLFYVALTRARRELHLTWCARRRVFGLYRERSPSRFLAEIPPELLEASEGTALDIDDYPEFSEGCGVYHDDYGPGVITRKWRSGRDTLVLVRLATGRTVRFILEYTQLERISVDEP